jgi:alkylated DNA nucleotide flippase Atl1
MRERLVFMSNFRRRGDLRAAVIGIASQIPARTWTTYGDIGGALGNRNLAQAVGTVMRTGYVPNAHRILTADGRIADGFTPHDVADVDPAGRLADEGIRFIQGKADPTQRWDPRTTHAMN